MTGRPAPHRGFGRGQGIGRPQAPAPDPLPTAAFDSHCHLDMIDMAVRDTLAQAAAAGVSRVITVGCDTASSQWSADCADSFPAVYAAVAIHPNETAAVGASAAERDAALAESPAGRLAAVRAVGETGFDSTATAPHRDSQRDWFGTTSNARQRRQGAMMIHDRDAHSDVLSILAADGAPERVIFHCYSGDAEMAVALRGAGYVLSFAGTVTFGNATSLREAAAVTPAELILAETDAPFLAPAPNRGKSNAPAQVAHTIRALAAAKQMDVAKLCAVLDATGERVFGPWDE